MVKSSIKKSDVITHIQDLSRARLAEPFYQQMESLSQLFYSEVCYQELENTRRENLYGAACGLLEFIAWRSPGEVLIRAFNPDVQTHGWESTHSIIEVVTDDKPYIVASLSMELQRRGLTIHQVVHPVVSVERDRQGQLMSIHSREVGTSEHGFEAIVRFEIDRQGDQSQLDAIARSLSAIVEDVGVTEQDATLMQDRLAEAIEAAASVRAGLGLDESGCDETLDYLRWLADGRFTFIGYAYYDLTCRDNGHCSLTLDNDSRLGILRFERHFPDDKKQIELSAYLSRLVLNTYPLILTKSTYRAPVVRAGHLDYLGVKRFDPQGRVIGEHRFFGLYSACAYNTPVTAVPMLRFKVQQLQTALATSSDSHKGRLLQQILEHYPRDEMLQSTQEDLEDILRGMLEAQDRPQLRLFTRHDVYGRFVTALVLVPREKYSAKLRRQMQQILLEGLQGEDAESQICQLDGLLVTVQYTIHTRDAHQLAIDSEQLEARLADAMLSWEDRLQAELVMQQGEAAGNRLCAHYGSGFPPGYKADFTPTRAVRDIERLEDLSLQGPLSAMLYRHEVTADGRLRFKLYGSGSGMALSEVLPILENLGVQVIHARPYTLATRAGDPVWMLDFDIAGLDLDLNDGNLRTRFQEAFIRTCQDDVENDGYNRLVVAAGLGWRDVMVLRAFGRYLSQIQIPFSQSYLQDTLVRNSGIAALLIELFKCRFDPVKAGDPAEALVARIEQALDEVNSLDEDRILRAFLAVLQAVLRTNFYQQEADGRYKTYLSLKLSPASIPNIPQPCPAYEIFVYSPRIEGVHLRGGKVARGGLRWSDRREDYRTEILGLLKAQLVKNAVIVPTGSKGGFYCKRLPDGGSREAIHKEGVSCYQTFIRGLLDITDNMVNDRVVPPAGVVRYDGDDPYLVVAADKGTATFSDIANGIAQEYGFWLDDAFASGGSVGYDHKKMGITARGAWESVKRHFLEWGHDTQTSDFTVVGIGDMAGDVFGNGMLLSRHIRLVAAFNHQHIFIDPNPDAETSYRERERLFRLPRYSWADYDNSLISRGGGVFNRSAKRIWISPEMREALKIDSQAVSLTPAELISAILKAPVDLLWNGGIGTYVKASAESHDSVGDRANDAVRINAVELRCRVVGEGGNLGITQRGRIEYARNGGRINTDAIDNAGGVDCSDHEVNIKVLLSQAVAQGDLSGAERDRLLADMAADVAQLVLRQNARQAAVLSQAVSTAARDLESYRQLAQSLEREGRLKPQLECLPNSDELAERAQRGEGLSRPEMAVLLAYGKIKLSDELAAVRLANNAYFATALQQYFPPLLRQHYPELIQTHPLKHDILATHFANQLVNRMGATCCQAVAEESQRSSADMLGAYVIARDLLGAELIWAEIEALGTRVVYPVQLQLLDKVKEVLEQATLWLLNSPMALDDVAATLDKLRPGVSEICIVLPSWLPEPALQRLEEEARTLADQGVPMELAASVTRLHYRLVALDIVNISETADVGLAQAASVYFQLDEELDIDWLRQSIQSLPSADIWQRKARASLSAELSRLVCQLSSKLLKDGKAGSVIQEEVVRRLGWSDDRSVRPSETIDSIRTSKAPTYTMLSVAVQELKGMFKPVDVSLG